MTNELVFASAKGFLHYELRITNSSAFCLDGHTLRRFPLDGAEGFAELEYEEDGGEGHGDDIRDGLGEVDAQGGVFDEMGDDVDEGQEQDELPYHRHDDRGGGVAQGDEGHLAGDLDTEDAQYAAVDAQRRGGKINQRRVRCEYACENAREQHDSSPDDKGIGKTSDQQKPEGFLDPLCVFGTEVKA